MDVATRCAGIPCIARVTHYHRQRALGPSADSDWDAAGYEEISFDLCDQRGRPAPWLERKLSERDADRIQTEISEAMQQGDDR